MNKGYYKEYYHLERSHWWFLARMKILRESIRKNVAVQDRKLKILNIGVATGATSLMLEEFGEVLSVEYDKDCCDFLREKVGIEPIEASILELPFEDNHFDLVCCFDVIEHIDDDKKAAEEISRVTKLGGFSFCTVPAYMFMWGNHDVINHHFRRYTMSGFKALFAPTQLKIYFKSYFNFFLFAPIAFYRGVIAKLFKRKIEPDENTGDGKGSDFEAAGGKGFLNSLLKQIFALEWGILRFRIPFPFGVSIMLLLQKPLE